MAQVPNVEKAYDGQDTRLLNAARNGEVNKISELIKQGVNVKVLMLMKQIKTDVHL